MRYEGTVYRPPSEGKSFILQASIGCSHNLCTYCAMYRGKTFRVRELSETLRDLDEARARLGPDLETLFVADGDALVLPMDHWEAILTRAKEHFPKLRRVSAYAMARNVLDKGPEALAKLRSLGLTLLYLGPESGDDAVLKRIVKGGTAADHVEAAQLAKGAGLKLSVILLLGVGGVKGSGAHAEASAELVTAMDPDFLSALTLSIVPGTPMAKMVDKGLLTLPDVPGLLKELRTIVEGSEPTGALFRTNHASNYLPLGGRLPQDKPRIIATIDAALAGQIPLRPEWARGL